MDPINHINNLLKKITPDERNRPGSLFLNSSKNEFITFPGTITVPRFSVKELVYGDITGFMENIIRFFPEFFREHALLVRRKPASDAHSLRFFMPLKGKLMDFVHFFKIDLRFGGDSSNVVEKGDTFHYPSYRTNRIYFKSRIVPVSEARPDGFTPLRLADSIEVDSDMHRHTMAILDEMNTGELTRGLLAHIDKTVFSTSQDLYPFFVFEFFTACMNVPYSVENELVKALELFEPLFISIFGKYRKEGPPVDKESALAVFQGLLAEKDGSIVPDDILSVRLRDYFGRYGIKRDDELALRGWWEIKIEGR